MKLFDITYKSLSDATTFQIREDSSDITFLDGSLSLNGSNNTGGENTTDSTDRINLYSYQRAASPNNFGEVVRIYAMEDNSKQMIAWYDSFTDPASPVLKAWIGWHYKPNDISDVINPHDHISIETPDAAGLLRTRLEIVATNADTTQVNTFNANFTVMSGILSVADVDGASKQFIISTRSTGRTKSSRWSIQGDSTTEAGTNAGTDFRLNRYADNGNFIDTVLFIKRSSGDVGIGSDVTSPSARLHVEKSTNTTLLLVRNTGASNTAANVLLQTQTSGSRVLQAGIQSDTVQRLSIEASGLIEWGAGSSTARDTNLYRSAADVLKTDDSFLVGADLRLTTKTPASAAATGVTGTLAWDSGFIYVCTATNTWKRVAIATW